MKIVNNKYLKLSLYLSLFCITGIKLAVADTPEYTEHYQVYNRTSGPITNLAISDFVINGDGVYHDPIISGDIETQQEVFPTSGLGGLVSMLDSSDTNAWDISYCSPSKCYKSNLTVDTCTLNNADIFSGSTAAMFIYDNGLINIRMANNTICTFYLDQPAQNPGSPQYTEHYTVTNDSSGPITSLSISDFVDMLAGHIHSDDQDYNYNFYHDPVLYVETLLPNQSTTSGLGLVSYYDVGDIFNHYGWNGWDISYCSSSQCYKSDISVDTCSLKSADIFDGSTASISIGDNGLVSIIMASRARCDFTLNPYKGGVSSYQSISSETKVK